MKRVPPAKICEEIKCPVYLFSKDGRCSNKKPTCHLGYKVYCCYFCDNNEKNKCRVMDEDSFIYMMKRTIVRSACAPKKKKHM